MNTGKSLTSAVAEVLIAEKAVKGTTYDELAEKTGISRAQIIRYIKGQRSPMVSELEAICTVLGLEPQAVMIAAVQRMGD